MQRNSLANEEGRLFFINSIGFGFFALSAVATDHDVSLLWNSWLQFLLQHDIHV